MPLDILRFAVRNVGRVFETHRFAALLARRAGESRRLDPLYGKVNFCLLFRVCRAIQRARNGKRLLILTWNGIPCDTFSIHCTSSFCFSSPQGCSTNRLPPANIVAACGASSLAAHSCDPAPRRASGFTPLASARFTYFDNSWQSFGSG